jgi:hypothetical protein
MTVMIRDHIPFRTNFSIEKKSNSRNSKSTYSDDTIKVTLEREYNVQHEFTKKAGGKITTVMIRGQRCSTTISSAEKNQMAVTPRVSCPTTQ